MFLSELQRYGALGNNIGVDAAIDALATTMKRVREITDTTQRGTRALLTVMATNGSTLVATRWGKELYWSTYKTKCSDRDTCPSLAFECEAPTQTGFVNHLIISSEPLGGENIWLELEEDALVGVDWRMRLASRGPLEVRSQLPVVN